MKMEGKECGKGIILGVIYVVYVKGLVFRV